jgi:threonine/homoserine/homoserine lactone efflux protein
MIEVEKLLLFLPTMLVISLTPGMCMTLAMTLGLAVGLRRTAWMMLGEVLGVSLVVVLCGAGISSLLLRFPAVLTVLKIVGGTYIVWLGLQLWRSRGALSISLDRLNAEQVPGRRVLAAQGFVTAIANPKGWAFFLALLPPFLVTKGGPINLHLLSLLLVVALSEVVCMTLYALGGRTLGRFLSRRGNVALINRVAGTMMIVVAIWLVSS